MPVPDLHCAKCHAITPSREVLQVLPGSGVRMRVLRCAHCGIAKDARHSTRVEMASSSSSERARATKREPSAASPVAEDALAFVRKLRAAGFTTARPAKRTTRVLPWLALFATHHALTLTLWTHCIA